VSLLPVALWDRESELELCAAGPSGLWSHVLPPGQRGDRVHATTLDAQLPDVRAARLLVCKLDIEGSELRALAAARSILQRSSAIVILELNDEQLRLHGGSVRDLLSLMHEEGFRAYTPRGAPLPPYQPHWPPWSSALFAKGDAALARIERLAAT
jgi:hypothetical protein